MAGPPTRITNWITQAALHDAFSMGRHCHVIDQLGGVFYVDPAGYPHLDLAAVSFEDRRPLGPDTSDGLSYRVHHSHEDG